VYIGVNYSTIRRWEDDPESMLKYSLKICDVSEATHADIVEAVESQLRMNVPKE
jgi:hypothetical protein